MEGYLTLGNIAQNSATHDINWPGLFGTNVDGLPCEDGPLDGLCSIQAGDGIGNVGGYQSNGLQGYMEEEDVNGYSVNWVSQDCVTPGAYVSVYWDQHIVSGYYEIVAYLSSPNCGLVHSGTAYMIEPALELESEAETDYQASGTCASYDEMSFGADANGDYSNDTVLQSSHNGTTWTPVYSQTTTVDSPYNLGYYSNPDAYGVYGQ